MRPRETSLSCPNTIAHYAPLRKAQSTDPVVFYCASGNHPEVPPNTKARARAAALKEIGKRIELARGKMTKAALARHCGFADASSITRVEAGSQALDVLPLIAAAKALGVTIDWILTGEGPLPSRGPAAPADTDQRRRQA